MNEDREKDGADAPSERPLQMRNAPDESFANPAGLGESECDIVAQESADVPCDPTGVEDLVLGESMPGFGIPGYDAEEEGGG